MRILLQLLLLVDSLDRKKERAQSCTVGISFSVATNLSLLQILFRYSRVLSPLKNKDLLTRQYIHSPPAGLHHFKEGTSPVQTNFGRMKIFVVLLVASIARPGEFA